MVTGTSGLFWCSSSLAMMKSAEYEVLKELPGYRAILKAVLKSQIQFLVEQLSEETEEETVLLSVSTADGTLSHIGSVHGKDFLNGKDEIMFQFLNYCLKKKHSASSHYLEESQDENELFFRQNAARPDYVLDANQERNIHFPESVPEVWHSKPDTIAINPLDDAVPHDVGLQGSQDENISPDYKEFPDTLKVDGEKINAKSISGSRKRKRKPTFIPNSQRRKASETFTNSKTEIGEDNQALEDKDLARTPEEADNANTQDESFIKVEPSESTSSEAAEGVTEENASVGADDANQYDMGQFGQNKAFIPTFPNTFPNQEGIDLSSYYNLSHDTDESNMSMTPLDLYKARMPSDTSADDGDRPHKCPTCGRGFKLGHHLRNHQSVHGGTRKFECDICKKTFMRKGTMQIHRKIHTRDTPFYCDGCQISFTSRDRLVYHKCLADSMQQEDLDESQLSNEGEQDYQQPSDDSNPMT